MDNGYLKSFSPDTGVTSVISNSPASTEPTPNMVVIGDYIYATTFEEYVCPEKIVDVNIVVTFGLSLRIYHILVLFL